ncbi:hypothetical protein FGE12_27510 [Aggregicoccus sp. 17bor-14]|uniref:hypothetical protein n=1 Tax=Myxococcaceae TaxID=31 RepID=UPI00129CAF0E|nr:MULTISPECIES: hypothetical protein [Myxococcaceae]MBF5046195.1 hypothetical protein [Simulacricoccus sp. 17bor-14]MRI91920.1 hypothetical protein [Aggregicoccus sp. 17bor-14]
MRHAMQRLWDDGFLLLLLLPLLGLLGGAAALGLELPLLRHTGLWVLLHAPGTCALVALVDLGLLAALALAQRRGERAVRAFAWGLFLVGVLGYVLVTPALAFTCCVAAAHLLRRGRAARSASPASP